MTAKPMKSTNDNPTPTTLRDELDNLYEAGYNVGDGFKPPLTKDRRLDQATQSIQEQLKALLPEEWYPTADPGSLVHIKADGFNQAIQEIEKAIEEWAK